MRELLQTTFAFQAWARARVLAAAEAVPFESLRRPVLIPGGSEDGSLRATLAHIAATQAHWLARFQGDAQHRPSGTAALADLTAIARTWEQADAGLAALVAEEDDVSLSRLVRYYRASTQSYDQQPLWQLLLHVSNHTTHHRAEACSALTALGSPPASTDFIDFLRSGGADGR